MGPPRATRRRRLVSTSQRPSRVLYCVHYGPQCPHLPSTGVTQLSKIRADMLAHEDLFECEHCGKRFGKVNGKSRHEKDRPRYCLDDKRVAPPLSTEDIIRRDKIQRARTYNELKALALIFSNEAETTTNSNEIQQNFTSTAFSSPPVEPGPSIWTLNHTNSSTPPSHCNPIDGHSTTHVGDLDSNGFDPDLEMSADYHDEAYCCEYYLLSPDDPAMRLLSQQPLQADEEFFPPGPTLEMIIRHSGEGGVGNEMGGVRF